MPARAPAPNVPRILANRIAGGRRVPELGYVDIVTECYAKTKIMSVKSLRGR